MKNVEIAAPPFRLGARANGPSLGGDAGLRAEEFEAIHGIKPIRGGAVSATWYGPAVLNAFNGGTAIDWTSNTIKVALATATYTPDQDTHNAFDDVTNEVSGTGYTAGGATLGGKGAALDTANDRLELDGADTSWTTASFTARYAIIYKDTGTPSTSLLLGYVDFGGDETVSSGTFTITWDAEGILQIGY